MGIYANVAVVANSHLFTGPLPLVIILQELMKLRGERGKRGRKKIKKMYSIQGYRVRQGCHCFKFKIY